MNFTQFQVIHSFNDVSFDDDDALPPLVICDIDLTIIRPSQDMDYYKQFNDGGQRMIQEYNSGMIKQTDPIGFNHMLQSIQCRKGKCILLTARGIHSHSKTLRDLQMVGIDNPEQFDIHYTNKISKGEYLKQKQTHLLDGYQHISFIDDSIQFISSVHRFFPDIRCYLFHFR